MTGQPEGGLTAALIAVQAQLPVITATEEAQATATRSYKYANLAAIHAVILPILAACGLAWITRPTMVGELFVLDYELRHVSGESVAGRYPLPASGGSQALGSAITYARRYTICAVLGIAVTGDDDDAQFAAAATMGSTWRPPASPASRKADRHRADRGGPLPDDQWTAPPENGPGTSTPDQHRRMSMLFAQLGVTSRDERLATSISALGLDALESSKDLSYAQAEDLCRKLQKEAEDVQPV